MKDQARVDNDSSELSSIVQSYLVSSPGAQRGGKGRPGTHWMHIRQHSPNKFYSKAMSFGGVFQQTTWREFLSGSLVELTASS